MNLLYFVERFKDLDKKKEETKILIYSVPSMRFFFFSFKITVNSIVFGSWEICFIVFKHRDKEEKMAKNMKLSSKQNNETLSLFPRHKVYVIFSIFKLRIMMAQCGFICSSPKCDAISTPTLYTLNPSNS